MVGELVGGKVGQISLTRGRWLNMGKPVVPCALSPLSAPLTRPTPIAQFGPTEAMS